MLWDDPWMASITKAEWVTIRNTTAVGAWSEYYNVYATKVGYGLS